MFYVASSEELKSYIIGQTQYSQYFRSENHFKSSIMRLGLERSQFDYFMIFSIPGEDEAFKERIKELDSKGFIPLNQSLKYLNFIFEITNNPAVFKKSQDNLKMMPKKEHQKNVKREYGEYKRILLTDSQYERLCKEFTPEKVKAVIKFLDEYVEGNNNKNNYSNFYIVIKRAINEKWYDAKIEYQKETPNVEQEETPDFVKDFMNNIK